ncbi:response regulator [Ferrovibrio sp.]|uniref:response regulator n=1 Tax=Ferrovibrio sp. TaxID=1917215 RepID=UPI0025C6A4AC|nr:response regulator [Ferrovibrio sp.]
MQIRNATILVVDDNESMRRLVRLLLRDLGVRDVLLAATVDEAFTALQSRPVDVIFTDWELDGETGLQLLQRLRIAGDGRIRRLPVVVMTAHAESWRVASARDAGASEFLVKPLSPAQVSAKLRAALLHGRNFIHNDAYSGPDRRRSQRPFFGPDRRQNSNDDGQSENENVTAAEMADALATLARLRAEFERFLADAAHQITLDARNARIRPELAAEISQRIFRLAHNIKGQGSSFDYPLATEIANELCNFLRNRQNIGERDAALISGYAAALDTVARNKVQGSGGELGQRLISRLRSFVAA